MSLQPPPKQNIFERVLGANYSTTLSGFATAFSAFIAFVAMLPTDPSYQLLQQYIPSEYKTSVVKYAAFAAFVSHIIGTYFTKSKNVTGGTVAQDSSGKVLEKINQ